MVPDLGRLALGMQSLPAHEARAAGDVERDHYALAGADLADVAADLLNDPHRLVTENVTLGQERPEHLVKVQIRPADASRGDAHDHIRRLFDLRIRNGVDTDVALAV